MPSGCNLGVDSIVASRLRRNRRALAQLAYSD